MDISSISITFVRHFTEMIVITGAAGFIGSCLAKSLNDRGQYDLILVDDFSKEDKFDNLSSVRFAHKIDRLAYVANPDKFSTELIIHIGARTDTMEFDTAIFDELNLNYSKTLWQYAVQAQIPLIYASSAATYGDGSSGFSDNEEEIALLKPLNPYGQSKQDFDKWVLQQNDKPPFWVGLKFFNVFGPNEYHKGRMASVVYHTFHQIAKTGSMRLFQSHHPDFKDGEQSRDFVYIKDVLKVIHFWQDHQKDSGIYNLGTGVSRSFYDLARAVFKSLKIESDISFIPTPIDLRETYQYYTKAEMQRTLSAGYSNGFSNLEESVQDYVSNHLSPSKYF
jgi:ADP-L-glycero-D-manno-heptose 6-epimerase